MKIAVLTYNLYPLGVSSLDLPPGIAAAIESIVQSITDGLVDRGHEVTLFAAGDSKTKARLIGIPDVATFHHPLLNNKRIDQIDYEYFLLTKAAKIINEGQFDLVHAHMFERSAMWAQFIRQPVVSTLHSIPAPQDEEILKEFKDTCYYVSISDAQRKTMPYLSYIRTIYHGVDLSLFQESLERGSYFAFLGRIVKDKGVNIAVRAIHELDQSLDICGSVRDSYREDFLIEVQPLINGKKIRLLQPVDRHKVGEFLGGATALLFPIQWEEPFGLVMIEAMACGTPIIAFARGSVPEVVDDGVTGFIVNFSDQDKRGDWLIKKTGLEGFKEAIVRINSLPDEQYKKMRLAARERVEKKFTVERMINNYEQLFQEIIQIEQADKLKITT